MLSYREEASKRGRAGGKKISLHFFQCACPKVHIIGGVEEERGWGKGRHYAWTGVYI